ncbi:MAG: copper resistance protein CopZ, partial [Magnetococcales bacterium]|nr:copper resistance protein CopZ [Magnetococcales bacterium]
SQPEEKPLPQDFTRDTMGYYCSMALVEHDGPKGQVHVAGERDPLWFSNVRDAVTYLKGEGSTRRIRAFYVNDMSQAAWEKPGPWMDGFTASFVVDSRQQSSMGDGEWIPFANKQAAEAFIQQQGGRLVSFDKLPNPS